MSDDSPDCQVFLVLLQQLSVLLQREVKVVISVEVSDGIVQPVCAPCNPVGRICEANSYKIFRKDLT